MIRGWALSASPSQLLGRREGIKIEWVIKTLDREDSESSFWCEHAEVLGGGHAQRRHESFATPLLPISCPLHLFHLVQFLSCNLYNKPVNVSSISLSSMSCSSEISNLKGIVRIPEFVVSQAEVWVIWTPHLLLASEVGEVLWTDLWPCDICVNTGYSVRTKWIELLDIQLVSENWLVLEKTHIWCQKWCQKKKTTW